MSQQQLMNAGVLAMRDNPGRIVAIVKKFQHPKAPGLTCVVHPIPTLGRPAFWDSMWYGLHNRFDRVLVEDGRLPARDGSGNARKTQFLRAVFPMFYHPMTVDTDINAGKYDMATPSRDPFETHLVYKSVLGGADPPLDPRARRAVEHLDAIADRMVADGLGDKAHSVVLPWNVYHAVYLYHRLPASDWRVLSEEEVHLIDRREIVVVVMTTMFFVAMVFVFTVRAVVGWLFGI